MLGYLLLVQKFRASSVDYASRVTSRWGVYLTVASGDMFRSFYRQCTALMINRMIVIVVCRAEFDS